jgi:cold shock CspA family protein
LEFIAASDGPEYSFHRSARVDTRFDALREWQAVAFEQGQDRKARAPRTSGSRDTPGLGDRRVVSIAMSDDAFDSPRTGRQDATAFCNRHTSTADSIVVHWR